MTDLIKSSVLLWYRLDTFTKLSRIVHAPKQRETDVQLINWVCCSETAKTERVMECDWTNDNVQAETAPRCTQVCTLINILMSSRPLLSKPLHFWWEYEPVGQPFFSLCWRPGLTVRTNCRAGAQGGVSVYLVIQLISCCGTSKKRLQTGKRRKREKVARLSRTVLSGFYTWRRFIS